MRLFNIFFSDNICNSVGKGVKVQKVIESMCRPLGLKSGGGVTCSLGTYEN